MSKDDVQNDDYPFHDKLADDLAKDSIGAAPGSAMAAFAAKRIPLEREWAEAYRTERGDPPALPKGMSWEGDNWKNFTFLDVGYGAGQTRGTVAAYDLHNVSGDPSKYASEDDFYNRPPNEYLLLEDTINKDGTKIPKWSVIKYKSDDAMEVIGSRAPKGTQQAAAFATAAKGETASVAENGVANGTTQPANTTTAQQTASASTKTKDPKSLSAAFSDANPMNIFQSFMLFMQNIFASMLNMSSSSGSGNVPTVAQQEPPPAVAKPQPNNTLG